MSEQAFLQHQNHVMRSDISKLHKEIEQLKAFKQAVQAADIDQIEDLYVSDHELTAIIGNTVFWTLEQVSKAIGSEGWNIGDGMYTLSGDVDVTINDILIKANVMHGDTHEISRHQSSVSDTEEKS